MVQVSGDVDISNAHHVQRAIDTATRQNVNRLVVDLGEVRFMDSSGLKVLIATAASRPQGSVVVIATQPAIRRIFAITGTDSIIPIVASLPEAIEDPDPAG
jgi:anti-sigma B factor antagonist